MRVSTISIIAWRPPGALRLKPLFVQSISRGAIRHGSTKEIRWKKEVRKSGRQARRVSDAAQEKGNAAKWTQREESHKPQAGDRDWIVGGSREGSESSAQARWKEVGQQPQIRWTQIERP